ncbi:unnamed protein product [Gadus morhua 'NCC']
MSVSSVHPKRLKGDLTYESGNLKHGAVSMSYRQTDPSGRQHVVAVSGESSVKNLRLMGDEQNLVLMVLNRTYSSWVLNRTCCTDLLLMGVEQNLLLMGVEQNLLLMGVEQNLLYRTCS